MPQDDDSEDAYVAMNTDYDDLIKRYQHADVPELQAQAAGAYIAKGVQHFLDSQFALGDMAEVLTENAIINFNAVINLYKATENTALQTLVAEALFKKSQVFQVQLKPKEQEACYNELLQLYMGSREASVQEFVAETLLSKGILMGGQGDHDAELQHYEVLIKRAQKSDSLRLNKAAAKALYNKGAVLGDQNKVEEALQAFSHLVKYYKTSIDPTLQKVVEAAHKKITFYQKSE